LAYRKEIADKEAIVTRLRICGGSLCFFALALLVWAGVVQARSGGINGYSGNPATNGGSTCNACHAGGQVPAVVLSGPAEVTPLSVSTYTLTISGGQEVAGGLDVSATAGTLVVSDPGTYLRNGEITHSSPRAVDGNGAVSWSFNWSAPPSEGTVVLYGAGNSVNLGNGTNGDLASSDQLSVTVAAQAATAGESSGAGAAPLRVVGRDPLTEVLSLTYETACETTDNNIYYGPLGSVGTYGWSGAACGVGTDGTVTAFDPGEGSYFFVIVGNKEGIEGSYGVDLQGGASSERPPFVTNPCGPAQDLTDRCD
jgi:hypothetical protein